MVERQIVIGGPLADALAEQTGRPHTEGAGLEAAARAATAGAVETSPTDETAPASDIEPEAHSSADQ